MGFRDGQCWSGSAASRAANRERRKGRRSSSGTLFRRRAVRLMISRVRERIKKRTGGCWGWSNALELTERKNLNAEFTENGERAERTDGARPPLQGLREKGLHGVAVMEIARFS